MLDYAAALSIAEIGKESKCKSCVESKDMLDCATVGKSRIWVY